jgi:hypothetical protein
MSFFTNFAYGVVSDWDKVTGQTDNYVNPDDPPPTPPPPTLKQQVLSYTTTSQRAIVIYSIAGICGYLIFSIIKKLL